MKINKGDLDWAVEQKIISTSQADSLWSGLEEHTADRTGFGFVQVLYYFGALIVIGAMTLFLGTAWESLGGGGIFVVALIYAGLFVWGGLNFANRPGLKIPSGLLITMAVCVTPLAVYGFQRWLNIWGFDDPGEYQSFFKWVKGGWFTMEITTIATGLIALKYFRFPFLSAPIAFVLWYISMDLTPIIFGDEFTWQNRQLISAWFGIVMIATSYYIDIKFKPDFAFWGYLFGMSAFWIALSTMNSGSEINKFLYFLINIGCMGISVFLRRRIFIVYGALGTLGYMGHLASKIFADSVLFPIILILFGLGVLYCGILLHRHGKEIETRIIATMPPWLTNKRPDERT